MKPLCLTFGVFLFFPGPGSAQTAEEKKATIQFLQSLQTVGGFMPARADPPARYPPTLRSTTAGLRALKYFGGELPNQKAAVVAVARAFHKPTGGFSDMPRKPPDAITTAIGIMAVVELKMPTEPYADAVVKFLGENAKTFEEIRMAAAGLESLGKPSPRSGAWLEQVAKMRNPDGTYGKGRGLARDTASAVVTVLRLGGKVEQSANVLKALKDGQQPDGGFARAESKESDLEASYRVMRCFHMLKAKPDTAKLRAFVVHCRNADGGYGVSPGQKSTVAATYFAGIILHWLDQ